MSYVELGCGGFYQHVIYVHLHGCSYLLLEHPVHQPLIGSSCVLEPEWHHKIIIGSLRCDERGLFLVVWVHTDLVVAGEASIKLRSSWPAVASTMRSIRGKGKLSFEHAL